MVAGFAARNAAAAAVAMSVNVTLLAESARRVGTAWPAAVCREDCGAGKAARKIRAAEESVHGALHNRLKLLESVSPNQRFQPFTALTRRFVPPTGWQG